LAQATNKMVRWQKMLDAEVRPPLFEQSFLEVFVPFVELWRRTERSTQIRRLPLKPNCLIRVA
jgi:hypothetical protein